MSSKTLEGCTSQPRCQQPASHACIHVCVCVCMCVFVFVYVCVCMVCTAVCQLGFSGKTNVR